VPQDVRDRVVLVSGAGRGIGRAVALAFAQAGAKVALLARSVDQLEAVAAEIGPAALAVPCDVAEPDQIASAVATAVAQLGPVDILVNNAGVFLDATLAETSLADWNRTLAVNATGVFLLTQAVLPDMIERGSGRIINIASSAGLKGYAAQVAYCASKHAVMGLSRALALEVKPHNIHVHCVCPGGVETEFIAGTRLGERLAGQTMIQPADIAEACLYLARQPDHIDIDQIDVRRFAP